MDCLRGRRHIPRCDGHSGRASYFASSRHSGTLRSQMFQIDLSDRIAIFGSAAICRTPPVGSRWLGPGMVLPTPPRAVSFSDIGRKSARGFIE
jgi:hypothetical protein